MITPQTVADWPIPIPTTTLVGSIVQLEPLAPKHYEELTAAGRDPVIWKYLTSQGDSPDAMRNYADKLLHEWQSGSAAPYAVRHFASARIVGCTRLKELTRTHRRGILGSWYAPQLWRTGVNLEAKLLLLEYAFATLGCVRIEFHTDTRNNQSKKSLNRLGATFEGVLRAHQITRNGERRDSAIFSILAEEWSAIRLKNLERMERHKP
jgi:N-acetyltransferase